MDFFFNKVFPVLFVLIFALIVGWFIFVGYEAHKCLSGNCSLPKVELKIDSKNN